jgi:hypothetical protein
MSRAHCHTRTAKRRFDEIIHAPGILGVLGLVAVAAMATLVAAAPAGAATRSTTAHPTCSLSLSRPSVGRAPPVSGSSLSSTCCRPGIQDPGRWRVRPATAAAVRSFQRSRHPNPSGIVGASTWNQLIVTLGRDSRSSDVRAVQHNLRFAYGFRFRRVTGFTGTRPGWPYWLSSAVLTFPSTG